MRIWKMFKVFVRGVMVALMVGMPMFNHIHAQAPVHIQKPQVIRYHNQDVREQCRYSGTYETNTPMFNYEGLWNTGYAQTMYDVAIEGGIQVSHGEYWNDAKMRVHNNDIQYYDEQYGWIQVYALNIDMVKQFGSVVTSDMLGSVIEVRFPDGSIQKGIVMDVCGACARAKKIDRYVYNMDDARGYGGHVEGIDFRFIRFGFDDILF